MHEIRWLYPTATARKAHAFIGGRPVRDHSLGDDVEQGFQSLCRKYGRYVGDHGWQQPDGSAPKDACAECLRRVLRWELAL